MINNTVRVRERTQSGRSFALFMLLTAGLLCSACTQSAPALGVTSEPAASATTAPSGAATVPGTVDGAAGQPATGAPTVTAVRPTPIPPAIRVVKTAPVVDVTGSEEYYLNNCGGIKEMRRPFSDAGEVWIELTVGDGATGSDSALIPVAEPIRSELAHQIQLAYQEELTLARTTVEQTEMVAGAQERYYVTVIWEDHVFAATVSFPSDGLTATAAYTYTLHVPTMGYFRPMPCTA